MITTLQKMSSSEPLNIATNERVNLVIANKDVPLLHSLILGIISELLPKLSKISQLLPTISEISELPPCYKLTIKKVDMSTLWHS